MFINVLITVKRSVDVIEKICVKSFFGQSPYFTYKSDCYDCYNPL